MKSRTIGRRDEILLMEDNAGDIHPIRTPHGEQGDHSPCTWSSMAYRSGQIL
jgi:hypothetical protein